MAQLTIATALPTRLAALAALGLLITACGTEPDEVGAPLPETESADPSAPGEDDQEAPPEGSDDEADEGSAGTDEDAADVELTIERTLNDDEALTPEAGYEEGVWTLTCGPEGGDHPDPDAACSEIDEVGTEPFLMDTSDMMCTMQMGGPEVVHVTGHVGDTEIDTEFNKANGCEIDRFETVGSVLNP